MGEDLGQLGGEFEAGIHGRSVVAPALCALRLQRPIERGVDLAAVEVFGDVDEFVSIALLYVGGIDDALPIGVLESSGAEEDGMRRHFLERLDETGTKVSRGGMRDSGPQ